MAAGSQCLLTAAHLINSPLVQMTVLHLREQRKKAMWKSYMSSSNVITRKAISKKSLFSKGKGMNFGN